MKKLDSVLNRIPMDRLVIVALAVIAATAVLFGALGVISFSALDMVVSAVTLLVSCYLSNRLFGLIFHLRPHFESAVITALLLFFLLWPSSDPAELWTVALTGILAMASKYLIAWRGRHLFNPAAIGAVLITLSGLNASVWWVGTGPLLPIVVVAGALVLYRTRVLLTGIVFVFVAVVLVVSRLLTFGLPVFEALSSAFLSYPIVFLAAFMLSEPLTLPPRLWQRLSIAVLAAMIFALPVSVGTFVTTPEVALVVANLVAFFCGQRRVIRLRLLEINWLTPSAREFVFAPVSKPVFRSGQYLELSLPHRAADSRGSRRIFSIASSPGTPERLSIGMTIDPTRTSSFKRELVALEPGAVVTATRIAGDFVLSRRDRSKLLFIAGGIGITPFISQISDPINRDRLGGAELIYSVRDPNELAYSSIISATGIRVLVLSAERPLALPDGWTWAGASRLSTTILSDQIPDLAERSVYLSGPPTMVTDTKKLLRLAGGGRVHTDVFSGY